MKHEKRISVCPVLSSTSLLLLTINCIAHLPYSRAVPHQVNTSRGLLPDSAAIPTSEEQSHCDCHWQYLKHYQAKGCTPIYGQDTCRCPVRFDCKRNFQEVADDTVCLVDGHQYRIGEAVNTSNNCERCHCRISHQTNRASVSCIPVECAQAFAPRLPEGCYLIFEEGRCCPVGSRCANQTEPNEPVCRHDGRDYRLGQKIYPEQDPCLICLCTRAWSGIEGPGCRRHDCQIERRLDLLRAGCIPIYHEKTCCPIEYHCASEEHGPGLTNITVEDPNAPEQCRMPAEFGTCQEAFARFYFNKRRRRCEEFLFSGCGGNGNRFSTRADCENTCGSGRNSLEERKKPTDDKCVFSQRQYAIGELLDINHSTHCVTCTCSVPPDFTCIHRSCPPPPGGDYERCTAEYKPGACCAQYNCERDKGVNTTSSEKNSTFGQLNSSKAIKPTCRKDFSCAPGCTPAPPSPSGNCPTPSCSCPIGYSSMHGSCIPPMDCFESGCALESVGGRCPVCVCHKELPGTTEHSVNSSSGVVCGNSQCDSGCRLDDQVPSSACPGCMCGPVNQGKEGDGRSVREARNCVPVDPRCTEKSGCRVVLSDEGCPVCKCKEDGPTCLPPDCYCPVDAKCLENGCRLYANTSTVGSCPVCMCSSGRSLGRISEEEDRVQCPSASKCPDGCQLMSARTTGCPTCKCEPDEARPCLPPLCLCSPPKCEPGCKVDRRVPLGRCPGCVCDLAKFDGAKNPRVDREPHVDPRGLPQAPKAHGTSSRECKVPHCEPPCKPETSPAPGQCPSCICRFEDEKPSISYPSYGREGGEITERRFKGHSQAQNSEDCPIKNCNRTSCKLVTVDGKCPECICTQETSTRNSPTSGFPSKQCPPADCNGEGCRAVSGPDGCPKCECRRQNCPDSREEERNCKDPCEWQDKPKKGGCPTCLCPRNYQEGSSGYQTSTPHRRCSSTSTTSCEGVDCKLVPGSDGCPTCRCRQQSPECRDQPHCQAPCSLQNSSNGRCRVCVCPDQPYKR